MRREGRYLGIVDDGDEREVPFGVLRPGERRALIGCAFAAGCICVMPQELTGAAICFGLAGVLGAWHLWKREGESSPSESAAPRAGK